MERGEGRDVYTKIDLRNKLIFKVRSLKPIQLAGSEPSTRGIKKVRINVPEEYDKHVDVSIGGWSSEESHNTSTNVHGVNEIPYSPPARLVD
jgi:hypothetical protein